MEKRVPLLSLLILLTVWSCSDETTVFKDDLQEDVVLETSETKLQSSISFEKSGVLQIFEEDNFSNKSSFSAKDEPAGDYPLSLVAQVKSPTYNGQGPLTASHVHVDGNYAYVSYNSAGEEYFGGIDIINISDPANPRLTSRVFYTNADINAVQYHDGFVYVVGGVDAETSVRATSNSFVAKLRASGGRFDLNAGILYGFQQGFNANDLVISQGKVWATSGKDGVLSSYNSSDLSQLDELPFSDLRSISIHNNQIALLDASMGIVILDENLQLVKEIPINSDFGDFAKKSIHFNGDKIMVSEGGRGTGVYSFATGALLEYIPILVNPAGVEDGDIVTNAVASNEKIVLMANGGAGLSLSEDIGTATDPFGIIELEGSINYVQSKGDFVFAASGKEGLQIIKLNRPNASLEARCEGLSRYRGSSKLFVRSNQDLAFQGSKRFNTVNIEGSLLLCGTWTVRNSVLVDEDGLFEMKGDLLIGRNNNRKELKVEKNATLRIEGNLTIYGKLILEEGATLEFIGPNNRVEIFEEVDIKDNVTITGDFVDVRNAFP